MLMTDGDTVMNSSGTISRRARALLLLVIAAIMLMLAACGQDNAVNNAADEATIRPDPVRTASGELCTPWMNQPGEADGSGHRACDEPIPQNRPVRDPGMSDADWFLAGILWQHAMGHSNFYYGPNYYPNYIGPAWNRHPGYSGYGWGHQRITRIDARTYNTTIVHVNNTYAADEKKAAADPKASGYHSASGKPYNGKNVPKTAFKSSNVPVTGPAGSARSSDTSQTQPKTGTSTKVNTPSNTSPGSSYTKGSNSNNSGSTGSRTGSSSNSSGSSSSGSSGRSGSSGSSGSSHSSGGHH
jgi:uncharacterized membrane protein YgcG